MGEYTKTVWADDDPPLDSTNLGHAETQYAQAMDTLRTCTLALGPTRAFDTVYQNTSGKPLMVCVSTTSSDNVGVTAYIGAASPPTQAVAKNYKSGQTMVGILPVMFLVPASYYYKLTKSGSPTKEAWAEWTLH